MKKIYYNILILFIACLTNAACTSDNDSEPIVNNAGDINFNINITDPKEISTREAVTAGIIESMYILEFDENGNFLTRYQATEGANPGNYNVRMTPTDPDQELDPAKRKRTLHIVCNYDWAGFDIIGNRGKNENEVLMMSVTNNKIAYWQKIDLPDGISQDAFPNTISLIRNVARISVTDNPNVNTEARYHLSDMSFAINNYRNYGTVAPLNFDENNVNESKLGSLQNIQESDFKPAGTNNNTDQSFVCYEKDNSDTQSYLCVIVKGKYDTDASYSYYKVDIFNENKEQQYDIMRNYHYILEVQKVTGRGSATLQEAINAPASNNLLYSVLLERYTSIADGNSVLSVETTERTLMEANREYSFPFSYIPDNTTGNENNSLVNIEIKQDDTNPIFDIASRQVITDEGKAELRVRTVGTLPDYDIYTGQIIFSVSNGVRLRRAVKINYRSPYEFTNVAMPTIPTQIGSPVKLSFTIPDNIIINVFPIEVFITVKSLSPDPTNDSGLTLNYDKPDTYRYKYIINDNSTTNHEVNFKTSSTTADEDVILESEFFKTTSIRINN